MEIPERFERVLITGVAGFIGHHLGSRLLENGVSVTGLDNLSGNYDRSLKERNLNLLRERSGEDDTSFSFEELDLLDRSALSSFFEQNDPDAVVHAAATAGAETSMEKPSRCLRTNVHGTSHLLEQVNNQEIETVLYVSSSAVYGDHEEFPFREDLDDLEPVSTYGVSKRAAEMICRTYHKHHGLNVRIVRPFTVYGPRQRPDMAVRTFAERIREDEPVSVYGDGSMKRDYTYATDAVDGLCRALALDDDWGVFNVGSAQSFTVNELVEQLGEAFGVSPDVERRPVPEGELRRSEADLEKAERELGYAPSVPLEEGIEQFVNWFRSSSPSAGSTSENTS